MAHVVTDALPGGALEILKDAGHDVELLAESTTVTGARLHDAMRRADGLLSMLTDPLPRAALAQAARLIVIGNCAVGYDNVDVEAASELGIQVCNTPDVLTEATADLAFALLLSAARRLPEADRFVRGGRFTGWRLGLMLGYPVHGTTLGIVGLGRIGRAVARRARGFSMRVVYTQRTRLEPSAEHELGVEFMTKAELFAHSDFVSLHLPLNAESRHYVDRATLALMKASAVLVNTGRGPVVDEMALAEALRTGRIAAAGLDVFEHEPAIEPALVELDNVVLLPHIGSATEQTRSAMARAVATDIVRVLGGLLPLHPVNRPNQPKTLHATR